MNRLATALLIAAITAGAAFAQTEADFRVDIRGTITAYTGRATAVVIPARIGGRPVTGIGERVFAWKNLTGITIPNSVTTIGNGAFWGNQLTSVTIPNSVVSIGEMAFFYNQLTGVTIPGSVTTIGNWAFSYNQLATITVDPANRSFSSKDGILYSKDGKTLVYYPMEKGKSAIIPGGVTTIGNYAFHQTGLTSVTIPNSVTTIGDGAFEGCQLISVNIGANVVISTNGYGLATYGDIATLTEFYNGNGKKAGVYTLNGNTWSYRAR